MRIFNTLTSLALVARTLCLAVGGKQLFIERDSDGLQDIVSAHRPLRPPPSTILLLHRLLCISDNPLRSHMMNIR